MYTNVSIYDRARLLFGHSISGPAIITEMDSNTFVHPDHRAEIDRLGNILLWPMPLGTESSNMNSEMGMNAEEDNLVVTTQIIEAALANARAEMDGLIVRVAMSPAMREQLDYVRGTFLKSVKKDKLIELMYCLSFQ